MHLPEAKVETLIAGQYANSFQIGYNAFEFVLDFGQHFDGEDGIPQMHTRIVTNPPAAAELLAVLDRSLKEYRAKYGGINP